MNIIYIQINITYVCMSFHKYVVLNLCDKKNEKMRSTLTTEYYKSTCVNVQLCMLVCFYVYICYCIYLFICMYICINIFANFHILTTTTTMVKCKSFFYLLHILFFKSCMGTQSTTKQPNNVQCGTRICMYVQWWSNYFN